MALIEIAVHQMRSGTDPAQNYRMIARGVEEAAEKGAQCYFAPEMALLLDSKRRRSARHIVREDENSFVQQLCDLASRHGIWLQIGLPAIHENAQDDRWVNRSLMISGTGKIAARYDKIHLFDVDLSSGESWHESKAYAPGGNPVLVNTPAGLMGLTICYDLRFSELYTALAKSGADILAIPAAFTKPTGEAHWHSLIRARAIETQSFVVAAAQCGKHDDGRTTYGHSLVVDPWGKVLLDMEKEEGLGFAQIDLDRLKEVRDQIPALKNRREFGDVVVAG